MLSKEQISQFNDGNLMRGGNADPSTCYDIWDKTAASIQLHTRGEKPTYKYKYSDTSVIVKNKCSSKHIDDIFNTSILVPFATSLKEHLEWVKAVYQPETSGVFLSLIDSIRRSVFNIGNYSISTSNKFANDYLSENNFPLLKGSNTTFDNFIKDVLMPFMLEDPNGILACLPLSIGEKGQRILKTFLVPSKNRITENIFIAENYLVYSDVGVYQIYDRDKKVFVFIDKYVKNEETGLSYAEIDKSYGKLFVPMRGVAKKENGFGYLDSFMGFLVPKALDFSRCKLLKEFFRVQLAPTITIFQDGECTTCMGAKSIPTEHGTETCTACNGTGINGHTMNFGAIINRQITEPAMTNGGSTDLFRYSSDPNTYLSYLTNEVETSWNEFKRASMTETQYLVQSGEAKREDKEAFYMFVSTVAGSCFDVMEDYLVMLLKLISTEQSTYRIQRPKSVSLKSQADVLKDFTDASVAGVSPTILNSKYREVVNASRDDEMIEEYSIVSMIDPYIAVVSATKDTMRAVGAITPLEYYISATASYWYGVLIKEMQINGENTDEVKPTDFAKRLRDRIVLEYENTIRGENISMSNAINGIR